MKKKITVFSALICISVIALVGIFSTISLSSNNARLSEEKAELQAQYDELLKKYDMIISNYSDLETSYVTLLLQPPTSVPNPGSSGDSEMQSRYQALQKLYSTLKAQYDSYLANYTELRSQLNMRLMKENIRSLVVPNDPQVVSLVYNITGKVGNTTDPSQYWKDIKAMYEWIKSNIKYRDDGLYPVLPENPGGNLTETDQMAQFPNETLALRGGDCEDTAILLTSMVRAYFNNEFLVEAIWITGKSSGHVAVQIPFSGDKLVILDTVRDYYSHDTLGDIALNGISTEIYNWMNIWRPSLGNDVHVYRVFSDYVDRYFDTTNDYIDWMYNR